MAVADDQPVHIAPTARAPHVEHRVFTEFPAFQIFLQRSLPLWPSQVQQALRLIALNGIVDPLSETAVSAASLGLAGANYRETLIHNGCLSRHRAVLLVLQEPKEPRRPGRSQRLSIRSMHPRVRQQWWRRQDSRRRRCRPPAQHLRTEGAAAVVVAALRVLVLVLVQQS